MNVLCSSLKRPVWAGYSNGEKEPERGKHYSICKFKRLIRRCEKEIEGESCHGEIPTRDKTGLCFFRKKKSQNIKDIVSKDWARLLVIYLEISALKG